MFYYLHDLTKFHNDTLLFYLKLYIYHEMNYHILFLYYGIVLQKECNPTQPHYANGEPVSFVLTNRITEFDKDYLIRRDGYDAEIVRVYRDPKENKFIKYIMVPVYNEEENYSTTYEYNEDELACEIIGINME